MKLAGRLSRTVAVGLGLAGLLAGACNKSAEKPQSEDCSNAYDWGDTSYGADGKRLFTITDLGFECLAAEGVSKDTVSKFSSRFYESPSGLVEMNKLGIAPEAANAFHERFRDLDIIKFSHKNIGSSLANAYDRKFCAEDIASLNESGVGPEVANAFDSRFQSYQIVGALVRNVGSLTPERAANSLTPEVANAYDGRFSLYEVKSLLEGGATSEVANAFDRRFRSDSIVEFRRKGISAEAANAYSNDFEERDVRKLVGEGISAENANRYMDLNRRFGTEIKVSDVVVFEAGGVDFAEIETRAKNYAVERIFQKWDKREDTGKRPGY